MNWVTSPGIQSHQVYIDMEKIRTDKIFGNGAFITHIRHQNTCKRLPPHRHLGMIGTHKFDLESYILIMYSTKMNLKVACYVCPKLQSEQLTVGRWQHFNPFARGCALLIFRTQSTGDQNGVRCCSPPESVSGAHR